MAKIVGSDHVKTTTGGVTDYLRSQWGLRKLFMKLTESRFRQMELWNVDVDGNPLESWVTEGFNKQTKKNEYEIKGWSKRYDHRHHSIDALVVALSSEKFIKRLNDLNKYFQEELAKHKETIPISDEEPVEEAFFKLNKEVRNKIMQEIESSRKFEVPFKELVSEAKDFLEAMVVSQKPKDKLAIKEDAKGNKQLKIRAALHQETYYGKTKRRDTKTISISNLQAKDIPQIIDKTLREDVKRHHKPDNTMKEDFTGERLIEFNESRIQSHKTPVYKLKVWYSKKDTENSDLQQLYDDNPKKSVITGDNYMFIIMEKGGKRVFDIASLYDSVLLANDELKENCNITIETIKMNICDSYRIKRADKPEVVSFYLQQNDLVYMPKNEDDELLSLNSKEIKSWLSDITNRKEFASRIYKVVKFTGSTCFFIPNNFAKEISIPKDLSDDDIKQIKNEYKDKKIPKQELNYIEFGTYSNCTPLEKTDLFTISMREGKNYKGEKPRRIQDFCVKIKTDWLGNIIEFNGLKL